MSFLILILSAIYFFETGSCIPEVLVVNGNNTEISQYPFMVSIQYTDGYVKCGGTIIAQSWVLSATHCVIYYNANEIIVEYGTTILSKNGTNFAAVKRIIMHEGYNHTSPNTTDIALLELEDPLIYDYTTIAPVTLPEPYFEIPQNESYVTGVLVGWSTYYANGTLNKHLQEIDLNIYSKIECKNKYPDWNTTNKLCAAVKVNSGECYGESGGPLLYKGSLQLGILTMMTRSCANPNEPGLYTDVSYYIPWINNYIYN